MYIRFVIPQLDEDSHVKMGVFQKTFEMLEEGVFESYEEEILQELMAWFNKNLKEPLRLKKSSKFHTINKAISWYKPSADMHVDKMRELISILEQKGVIVEMLKTDNPGYIVYEGRYQIVAEPFKETNA